MEEIKQEQVQPTVTVTEKVEKRTKRSREFYAPIMAEIASMKVNGKSTKEIKEYLKTKYPDIKPGSLMAKYSEWKKNQNKQGE